VSVAKATVRIELVENALVAESRADGTACKITDVHRCSALPRPHGSGGFLGGHGRSRHWANDDRQSRRRSRVSRARASSPFRSLAGGSRRGEKRSPRWNQWVQLDSSLCVCCWLASRQALIMSGPT
jgi:hypothetical protein